MSEALPQEQPVEDYGAAEVLAEGMYSVGRFEAIAVTGMEHGFTLAGEDTEHGKGVDFSLSPREALLLGDLIYQNRENLIRGLQNEAVITARDGGNAVYVKGDGPSPIPTNNSMLQ
ncbi:hypothetical protein E1263_05395 [Kribbella antibiotica]|uniref:Uncharacterized protein n=1 Tax=Kribbella antibiotica TaxID=190195 RepID=A0A4V2YQH1_9ACTN|nr:hypothetical protein [Kribbella antibiotica]TDD62047.1 hypothetical protein E1263_05395 [Kribbella antibiotica]